MDYFDTDILIHFIISFKDFNDCLHTAIAEQRCSDFYTCNYRDFKRIQSFTSLNIHSIFYNKQN